nr:hypothetical transcript [Hymenolepis microstoma]
MNNFALKTPPQSPQFDDFYDVALDETEIGENTDTEDDHCESHCLSDNELHKAFKLLDPSQTHDFLRRFLYIIKGIELISKTANVNQLYLLHIRLDILSMLLKFVEFHPASFNEILELDPSSSNPQEYIMEWVFDLLITASSSLCPCYSLLWVLLIRHGERVSKGWYKYLHAKIVQLHSGRRRITRGYLDSVRGNIELMNSNGNIDRTRLYNVYWSVLVATAPVYEKAMFLLVTPEQLSTLNTTSRFSTAVWIIRNQFLGDNPPSKESIRHALQSLLALQGVWGAGVEIIRSLWLYFSRKLDSMSDIQSKNASSEFSEVHPFYLFCEATIQTFLVYPTDVLNIIRLALPTLTRQGVTNYFILLGNMLEGVSNSPHEKKAATELAEFVISLFGGVEEAQLKWSCDWEVGRRCAALEGLQKLLTYLSTDSPTTLEFEEALTRLMQLTSLFREALLRQISGKNEESTGSFSNFTTARWRDNLAQMALSFCKSLLSNLDKTKFISGLLDTSLIDLLCSSERGDWLHFLRDFLSSLRALEISCLLDLNVLIWSVIFPQFVSRACTNSSWSKESAEVAVQFISIASMSPLPETTSLREILQDLVFKADLDFSFRTKFFSLLFSNFTLLKSLLSNPKVDIEQAWQFYTVWLTYKLLSDKTDNDSKVLESLFNRGCDLPDGVSGILNTSDAEISMIRLCNRFEAVETFQDRMAFKSATLRRLAPLGQLLNSIMESFITPQSTSRSYSDIEITRAYKATASLFQVTSALLYSPDGVFNELFASFLMPPWRHLEKELPNKKIVIQNCVAENLPSFLRGMAQLNFLKDPFIIRMLRELLRAAFFAVPEGMDFVVSAMLISEPASYRVHLLKVLAQEFISFSGNSHMDLSKKAKMWLNFCQKMDEGTMTVVQRLRDAPFLLWPLAVLLSDSSNSKSFTSIENSCNSAFSTFTSRWESIESASGNNFHNSELQSLRAEISDELEVIYRLNTNPSVTNFLKQTFKKSGFY